MSFSSLSHHRFLKGTAAASATAIESVAVTEEENVAETIDVQKSMESMVNCDEAKLLFPTSFG